MTDQRGQLLRTALGFAGLPRPSYDRALWALRTWLDSWSGIGRIAVGMARQGFDLQLTRCYDEQGLRATFYTIGMEHSPTSATGTGWERTPWHATKRAAWGIVYAPTLRLTKRTESCQIAEGLNMTSPAVGPSAFRDFEQTGWNTTAGAYDRSLGTATTVFTNSILDAADVQNGSHVLDVATGPGYIAAAAALRGAEAIGIDFAPNMVIEARRLHPRVTFQEGDAEALPFPGERFDAVVIGFGMLHFSRPELVLAEVRRVLRPGGRLAFTVWGNPHGTAAALGILLRAVETHGTVDVGLPAGPPLFRFSDHTETRRVLLDAGFVGSHLTDLPHNWRLPHPDALVEYFIDAGVRAGELLRRQTPAALQAIKAFVHNEVAAYEQAGVIAVPMGAVLASAIKPVSGSL